MRNRLVSLVRERYGGEWISCNTLAKLVGCSVQLAHFHLARAVKAGDVQSRPGGGGGGYAPLGAEPLLALTDKQRALLEALGRLVKKRRRSVSAAELARQMGEQGNTISSRLNALHRLGRVELTGYGKAKKPGQRAPGLWAPVVQKDRPK